MKKKYILALTFLFVMSSQLSFGQSWGGDTQDIIEELWNNTADDTDTHWEFDPVSGNIFGSNGDVILDDGTWLFGNESAEAILDLASNSNLTDAQFNSWYTSVYGANMLDNINVVLQSNGSFDHGQFMSDATASYLARLDELGLRDVTRDNLYTLTNGLNSFGNGFVYVGAVLTATGVFSEVGLPMIGIGGTIGNIATFGQHGLDIYYGTFNGQQFMIDVAFWGVGKGFDFVSGAEGQHTGYFYIWNEGSKEWIKFMNNN